MKRLCIIMSLLALLTAVCAIPVCAQELNFVTDEALLLSDSRWETLELMCIQIADEYDCGVYIITLEEAVEDAFDTAQSIYHDCSLGVGSENNGILLFVSVESEEVALYVYGEDAEYAVDAYGAKCLEEAYLPYLRDEDWDTGFEVYVETCREYLQLAQDGEPVRASESGGYLIAIVVSFAVSLVICLILKAGMKNVHIKTEAAAYTAGALHLVGRTDRFTHKTQTRTKINTDSGKARSGGGGHGRSAKL